MPFGTKNPHAVCKQGVVIRPHDDYRFCPVCDKDLTDKIDGDHYPVALIVFNKGLDDVDAQGVFGCSRCYRTFKRLDPNNYESLRLFSKKENAPERRAKLKETRKPEKTFELSRSDVRYLRKAQEILNRILGATHDVPELDANDGFEQMGQDELDANSGFDQMGQDDLDDLEFGMTDEQKARMAAAVAQAAERVKQVPQETWRPYED